jgi:hypothetical protein
MALTSQQIQQMNQLTGLNKPATPAQATNQSRIQQLQEIAKANTPAPQQRPAIADVAIGAAKTGASFLEQGDVLGTMSRLQKGDTTDLNPNKITAAIGAADPLKTMHSLAGEPQFGVEAPVEPSKAPDWTGLSPADRAQANEPTNYAQKVGQTAAIVAANVAPFAKEAMPAIKETAGNIKESLTPKPLSPEEMAASKASDVAAQKQVTAGKVQKVADEWAKPTIPGKASNPASFNKATAILEKSPDTPKFLAEQKLAPSNHIENGRYATADSADAMRETAGKMSRDTLRPSLQMADYAVPKTPVAEIQKTAIANATKDTSLTAGEREAVIRNINKEAQALQRSNPDGLSLTDMHDSKITYAQKGGYRPDKSALDNNIATANRNLSSALGDAVETKAPKDIPVHEFNQYLTKYYKAADYLDALNTKTAPVSLLQNVAHRGAQVIGAAVGHSVGGGILGGVGGYMIGGALEHAIENMALPMRDSFLRNLKITNPEAYTKVAEFIGKQEAERATRLALPEGKALGTSENPHIVAPTDTSGVQMIPASKTLPTANPKTGRMQKTFQSSIPE